MDQAEQPVTGVRLVHVGIAAFVVACVVLFMTARYISPVQQVEPGFPVDPVAKDMPDGTRQVTLDSSDSTQWVPFSLELGRRVPDGAAADLLVRRQLFRVPGGAARLGDGDLETFQDAKDPNWKADVEVDGIPRNPILSDWYSYAYTSHLLRTRGQTFAVRSATG
ncbi:MAG: hypothetical protein QGG40_18970, partial [Myxococcota bacterium]|nr:hypothetical protein [Myxococcota bacterium]